jgi:hypothetical protein
MTPCAFPGCDREYSRHGGAYGLCPMHYARQRCGWRSVAGLWPHEVAEILGVSTRTVQRYWNAGLLTGQVASATRGDRRISRESLAAYVRDHGTDEQRERLESAA